MKRRIRFGWALLLAALIPLPSLAQQHTAVRLDSPSAPPLGHYVYLPAGYNSGTAEWPLVVFLHGIGDIGDGNGDLSKVLNTGVPQNIQTGTNYPFLVISPQSSGFWDAGNLDAMIEFVKNNYRVDLDRIYLTGASMGGGGVWDYAKAHPAKLAAILPICGTASLPDGPSLTGVPTWAFHSWGDPTVSASNSVDWANEIAEAIAGAPLADVMASYPGTFIYPAGTSGATSDRDRTATFEAGSWTWSNDVPQVTDSHPNLTLYSDASHFIWTRTYANQTVWDWLLAQDRDSTPCHPGLRIITPAGAGAAQGVSFFPLQQAFDAQPTLRSALQPAGGSGGSDAPAFTSRVGYIDFGPDWADVRITSTWTRYRAWTSGNQSPYTEVWWDDDTDTTNDGVTETGVSFNSAQGLAIANVEPWVRDADLCSSPVAPQARYLLLRTPSTGVTDRAKEYAIVGYIVDPAPDPELIEPTGAGAAQGVPYFPMQDAFDAPPTLDTNDEPVDGGSGNDAPFLGGNVGYIDFGPDWADVRITATWTRYREWSTGDQTPYDEVWWDDDTDTTNDGVTETDVNFNTALGLNTGLTEPWLRDRDLSASPVTPQGRYLLCRSPSSMTGRAKEYAIIGYTVP